MRGKDDGDTDADLGLQERALGGESSQRESMLRQTERLVHRMAYFGIQRLRARPVDKLMRELRRWDDLDAETYREKVRHQIAATLAFAYERVPLYRSHEWRAAIGSDPTALDRWPVVERLALKTKKDALLAQGLLRPTLYTRRSSASTGTPVEVVWNLKALAWSWAAEYHPMLWHGLQIGARTLRLWGSAHPIENRVLNRHYVPASELTADRLEAAIDYVRTAKPELIWGTASAVHELARYVLHGIAEPDRPHVPYAKVGGEQVYPFQRREIQRAFGTRLVESYGSTEVGPIAAQCEQGSMHVLESNVYVEIFDGDRPAPAGEFGEIVVTSLVNRGMPLVRCRIGDHGRMTDEPCRCGRPYPVLAELRGRAADVVVKSNGEVAHGSILGRELDRYVGKGPLGTAQKVLFEQIDPRSWRVMAECLQNVDRAVLQEQAEDVIHATMGPDCRVLTEATNRIPREPSGKYRYYKAFDPNKARG